MSIIAGFYVKNKDYSEAIANETDESKRNALLNERQNKIDAEGLRGKVASNDAVSQWSGSYRPYATSAGGATIGKAHMNGSSDNASASCDTSRQHSSDTGTDAVNIGNLYDAIERQRLAAFEAARQRNARLLAERRTAIEQDYILNTAQAQMNARLQARGNEEKLAALGLNTSGMYGAPTSGYAESTRIAADNAFRNELNSITQAKQNALYAAQNAADAADVALRTQDAAAAANAAQKLASMQMSQHNADREYALQQQSADRAYALQQQAADRKWALSNAAITGYLNGMPTLDYQKYYAARAQQQMQNETAAKQRAFQNAMTRWKTYGYVLPPDAPILGVPAGTSTADEHYSASTLRLNQIKTAYQTRK